MMQCARACKSVLAERGLRPALCSPSAAQGCMKQRGHA